MLRADTTIRIPNPHQGDIGRELLARILRKHMSAERSGKLCNGVFSACQSADALDGGVSANRFVIALRELKPAIAAFFLQVPGIDEDPTRRDNCLALLQGISALPEGITDLSQLEGF